MAINFPPDADPLQQQTGQPNIARTWQYVLAKNRWELITEASLSFGAELPIVITKANGEITHDFDVQDLPNANVV